MYLTLSSGPERDNAYSSYVVVLVVPFVESNEAFILTEGDGVPVTDATVTQALGEHVSVRVTELDSVQPVLTCLDLDLSKGASWDFGSSRGLVLSRFTLEFGCHSVAESCFE